MVKNKNKKEISPKTINPDRSKAGYEICGNCGNMQMTKTTYAREPMISCEFCTSRDFYCCVKCREEHIPIHRKYCVPDL